MRTGIRHVMSSPASLSHFSGKKRERVVDGEVYSFSKKKKKKITRESFGAKAHLQLSLKVACWQGEGLGRRREKEGEEQVRRSMICSKDRVEARRCSRKGWTWISPSR